MQSLINVPHTYYFYQLTQIKLYLTLHLYVIITNTLKTDNVTPNWGMLLLVYF